jgi:hypothetical protein
LPKQHPPRSERGATARRHRGRQWLPARGLLATCLAGAAFAGSPAEPDVSHWAIAPFFGTGAYRISAEQSIFAIGYAPRWTIEESSDDWIDDRPVGIEIVMPMALGLNSFDIDEIEEIVDIGNIATVSVVPGVYVTIPMSARWTLLGIANLGAGIRLDGDGSALTYRAGVRSRYRFGDPQGLRWSLLSTIEYIGYRTDGGRSADVLPISLGVEFENRLAMTVDDAPVDLVTHLVATDYVGELRFDLAGQLEGLYSGDIEIGFALHPAAGFRLLGFDFERIGIAFRGGLEADGTDASGFRAVRIYFRSVFTQ